MKIFNLFFAIIISQSCISQSNKISSNNDSLKDDAITSNNYYQRLVGTSLKVDSSKNPFLTIGNKNKIEHCDSIKGNKSFNCIIQNFFKCKFPIELGPKPEPQKRNLTIILDSVFIVKSLGDTKYFKTEPGDRTAGYYYGSILNISDNYILCLIPYIHCCGHDYYLYSINKNGELIDKICVGGFSNDTDETYGILQKADQFDVYVNEFDFEKGRVALKNKQQFSYKISSAGMFQKE